MLNACFLFYVRGPLQRLRAGEWLGFVLVDCVGQRYYFGPFRAEEKAKQRRRNINRRFLADQVGEFLLGLR